MPHLLIAVDGDTRYEGEIPDIILPADPAMIPEAMRSQPGQPPTPLARLTMLTAIIEVMRRALESPMFNPIEVEVKTHGAGKATIAIDMTLPGNPVDAE